MLRTPQGLGDGLQPPRSFSSRLAFLGSVPARRPSKSTAILGLENRSGDGSQDYFADGFSNRARGRSGRLNDWCVISPGASLSYRGTKKLLPEIGKELNADVLLDGTVSRAGNRAQITARLVNARSGRSVEPHL